MNEYYSKIVPGALNTSELNDCVYRKTDQPGVVFFDFPNGSTSFRDEDILYIRTTYHESTSCMSLSVIHRMQSGSCEHGGVCDFTVKCQRIAYARFHETLRIRVGGNIDRIGHEPPWPGHVSEFLEKIASHQKKVESL